MALLPYIVQNIYALAVQQISPLPKSKVERQRKRKTEGAAVVTSSPYKQQLFMVKLRACKYKDVITIYPTCKWQQKSSMSASRRQWSYQVALESECWLYQLTTLPPTGSSMLIACSGSLQTLHRHSHGITYLSAIRLSPQHEKPVQ